MCVGENQNKVLGSNWSISRGISVHACVNALTSEYYNFVVSDACYNEYNARGERKGGTRERTKGKDCYRE